MAYTKDTAKHDRVVIDGTDVSNAFREIDLAMVDSLEDASGFSASGTDETLPGTRAQGYTGTMFYTEEAAAIIFPIYRDRELVPMLYQPQGLVDSTREIYSGNVYITEFHAAGTRGTVRTTPFTAVAGDATGITVADFT